MIETELINPNLVLENPVDAFTCYSHDPALEARARTVNGQYLTALELQYFFLEEARRFEANIGFDGIVPGAGEILSLWENILNKLRNRQFAELRSCIDWVLKLHILERAMAQQPELTWDSPQIKHLDQLYSSLDEREGLYWIYERGGYMQSVVGDEQIEGFMHNPPEDTRAYTRSMLLRSADPTEIDSVDWDSIGFSIRRDEYWSDRRTMDLSNPLSYTKAKTERCFRESRTLEETLDAIEVLDGKHRPELNVENDSLKAHSMQTH
jgi:proteasome accessory factor A